MGKRSTQRKNAFMLDSDDDVCTVTSSSTLRTVSSSSTLRSDRISELWNDEELIDKDHLLDESLDALYEKRGSVRENALSTIIMAFRCNQQAEFVEVNFATLLNLYLSCIKKGSTKEITLAAHAIGLLALTVGCGDNAHEMWVESIPPLAQALKSGSESSKISSLLSCLAIVTFACGNDSDETEKAMEIMWQLVHPKLGSIVGGKKPTASVIIAVVSCWSFLLTTMDGWMLHSKNWKESISYLCSLLDMDDRSVRIAAGEALALIFEIGSLDKFSSGGVAHIQGLKGKVINQVRDLAVEAGGRGSTKKDLTSQRNLFRNLLEFLEDGYCPETAMKIAGDSMHTNTWTQLIQLKFLKHFLRGAFTKQMQENEFLQDVFQFTPKKKCASGNEQHFCRIEKRMYKSPNSVQNKARTRYLNKQRTLSADRDFGHYATDEVY